VEEKRYHRTLVAVINGVGVARAIRDGLIMEQSELEDAEEEEESEINDESSLFVPETRKEDGKVDQRNPFLPLNPQATTSEPKMSVSQSPFVSTASHGHTNSTEDNSNAAAASPFPSGVASVLSNPPISSIFGDNAPFKNPFGPQSTMPPTSSSIFNSAPAPASSAPGSFGLPSFVGNAPSSSAPMTASSLFNNPWLPVVVNEGLNSGKLTVHILSAALFYSFKTGLLISSYALVLSLILHPFRFLHSAMDYDPNLFEDMDEPFAVFQPIPSALSDPQLPRELRRASLTYFVIDNPGDNPELVAAHELDTKPLGWPVPTPLADQTNVQFTKPNTQATSLDKPPASPRPSFRPLPTTSNMQPARPLFPDLSQINPQTPLPALNNDSASRFEALDAQSQTQNTARDLSPVSVSKPVTSTSSSADQYKNNGNIQDRTNSSSPQTSPLTSKTQSTTKQSFSPKTTSIPPLSTNKSAIPPTFPPNGSPSFTTPASTKPKHKSPLGSQPPIFAAESSAKSSSPQQSSADSNKAADNLAIVGFLEPHGILQQYIEHTATALIEDALRQFEREEPLRAARKLYMMLHLSFLSLTLHPDCARHHILSKKYFGRWKAIYWRRKLNRNATGRRKLLSQSIRRESQRKARGDAELEAIFEAQRQKDRIQAEQLRKSQEDPNSRVPVSAIWIAPPKPTKAGQKRKSLHGDEINPITNGNSPRKIAKGQGHRRSKTIAGMSTTSRSSSLGKGDFSPSSSGLSSSILSGRPILLDRSTGSGLRRSTSSRKTDSTNTDYFRLKALGVDPDTPLFPDTKSSLERKRRRQEEVLHLTPRKRASTLSSVNGHSSSQERAPDATKSQPRNITAPEKPVSMPMSSRPETTPQVVEDDDDFLRQIRQVRAALSEDAAWFRTQAAEIEKEVAQQEEMRKSASQRSSTNSPAIDLPNPNTGLTRVNGYDYTPAISGAGSQHSLSRTEQRIRATGAHGLATRPVSDYLPVAMSKSTRASLINNEVSRRPKKRKGKTKQGEKDSKYVYESEIDDEAIEMRTGHATRKRVKKVNHNRRVTASNHLSESEEEDNAGRTDRGPILDISHPATTNHHELVGLGDDLYEEGEEEEAPEEEEDYVYSSYDDMDRANEGDEDEDEVHYDESLNHLNDNPSEAGSATPTSLRGGHGAPDPNRRANPFHMRLRSATPEAAAHSHASGSPGPGPGQDYAAAAAAVGGTQMSRATSGTGTGVSADDALVLSD
jgi:hypothetical protein